MNMLFPHHPCMLAQASNEGRCRSLRELDEGRCAACRRAMRGDVWKALVEGDRSFVEFVLADDALTASGFSVVSYEGTPEGDPVFALVRSTSNLVVDSGDCSIAPIPGGRYRVFLALDEERDYVAECDDLVQAAALLSDAVEMLAGEGS